MGSTSNREELFEQVGEILARAEAVDVGLLFGSVVGGTPGFDSDVDVAIFGKRAITAEEKMALIEEVAGVAGRPVDLVDLRTVNPTMLKQVLDTGTFVYVGSDEMKVQLLKKSLFDQADWQPLRERMLRERREKWVEK